MCARFVSCGLSLLCEANKLRVSSQLTVVILIDRGQWGARLHLAWLTTASFPRCLVFFVFASHFEAQSTRRLTRTASVTGHRVDSRCDRRWSRRGTSSWILCPRTGCPPLKYRCCYVEDGGRFVGVLYGGYQLPRVKVDRNYTKSD